MTNEVELAPPPVVAVPRERPMPKIPRTAMRSWAARQAKVVQDGLCPLCGKPLDLTIKGEGVIDHDHDTGEVRGVLHRSCNAAEGKIANAAGQWGAKSTKYSDILAFLKSLVAYLQKPGTGMMYPMHKTPDEKRDARNAKARAQRAKVKAVLAMRKQGAANGTESQ